MAQGLSQDLETGCLKLAIVKILGVQIFKGDNNVLRFQQNMYKIIKIRHDILIQCHGNYMEMRKLNYMLEIKKFKKFFTKVFGCPKGCFLRVWVSKKTLRRPAG